MTTPTQGEHAQPLRIEAAYSGDKLIGYTLATSGTEGTNRCLVWMDQAAMPGIRLGDRFVPCFGEQIEYRPVPLEAPAQPAAPQGGAYAEMPGECDSPELCAVNRACAGKFGTQRICASHGQAPAGATVVAKPKVVLELPDGDTRTARVHWSEMQGDTLHLCISVDTPTAQPAPAPTPQADSQPAPQGETNAQLDTDSDSSAPGQQRDVAGTVALGQPVGHGSDSTAGDPSAQGDKLLTVAERNIRSFLRSATFKTESDREAALNCVDVLWAAARAPADSVTAPAGGVAPVAIKMVGYGGCTGINDYLMSDGSIKTMRPHEVIWRDAAHQAAPIEPMANDIHGALTAAAIYLTNAQRQYGKEMHRQAIASLEKAQRAIAQAADFAKAAPGVLEDAARYRHLREADPDTGPAVAVVVFNDWGNVHRNYPTGDELDAVIDAARKQGASHE